MLSLVLKDQYLIKWVKLFLDLSNFYVLLFPYHYIRFKIQQTLSFKMLLHLQFLIDFFTKVLNFSKNWLSIDQFFTFDHFEIKIIS